MENIPAYLSSGIQVELNHRCCGEPRLCFANGAASRPNPVDHP